MKGRTCGWKVVHLISPWSKCWTFTVWEWCIINDVNRRWQHSLLSPRKSFRDIFCDFLGAVHDLSWNIDDLVDAHGILTHFICTEYWWMQDCFTREKKESSRDFCVLCSWNKNVSRQTVLLSRFLLDAHYLPLSFSLIVLNVHQPITRIYSVMILLEVS